MRGPPVARPATSAAWTTFSSELASATAACVAPTEEPTEEPTPKPTPEPTVESPTDATLFFVFGDATNGTETYGAGRFLYATAPKDGSSKVVLDFNLAQNPPCAFTPYATCPLVMPRNVLPERIEAGEKVPAGH